MSERRLNNLKSWVKQGGGLIVVATELYDEEEQSGGDELLDELGISLFPTESKVSDVAPGTATDPCERDSSLVAVPFEGDPQPLLVHLPSTRYLYFEDQPTYISAANISGAQIVYAPLGEGYVYVLTSLSLWRNANIVCSDNAHLLRTLTSEEHTLWWLRNTEIEPITELIWQNWPIAVGLAGLWLVLWLWRSAYRSTRIELEEVVPRREILEHITGMARFLHQQGELDALLSGLRRDCLAGDPADERWRTQYADRIHQWSVELNTTDELVRWALFGRVSSDPVNLSKAVVLLQKIRELADR